MNIFKRYLLFGVIGHVVISLVSCSDDDTVPDPIVEGSDHTFFISASGESAEYILTMDSLDGAGLSIAGAGIELEQSGYTWIFNDDPSAAIGLIYQQGDPGLGLGYTYDENGLQNTGSFQVVSRFTSYGFFENNAITSVGGQTPTDANGNALTYEDGSERIDATVFNVVDINTLSLTQRTILTHNLTGNDQQATFSGVVDMGDGTFLTGIVVSQPKLSTQGGGASTGPVTMPDSCWVARINSDFVVEQIYRDGRLSYSSGRYRSQYYSQIGKDEEGNVYVFSGAYQTESTYEEPQEDGGTVEVTYPGTTKAAGAIRIPEGGDSFDSYYFNIESASGGYTFRRVWPITEDYFLLEFYNEPGQASGTNSAATQYGIVKMAEQTFTWLSGAFPSKDIITGTGLPTAYNGKVYFPVTVEGADPVIYVIDPASGSTTAGISVEGATAVNAVGVLKE